MMAIRKLFVRPGDVFQIHVVTPEHEPLNKTGFMNQCTSRQDTFLIKINSNSSIDILDKYTGVRGGRQWGPVADSEVNHE